MTENTDQKYQKFVYWLETNRVPDLKTALKKADLDVFTAKKAVCIPLSDRHEATFVPPEAFEEYDFCRRQLTWYKPSPFYGKTLLVSSRDLTRFGLKPETIITEAPDFKPPKSPGVKDIDLLSNNLSFLAAQPAAFADLAAEGPEKLEQWLKVLKLKDITFDKLFKMHQANHANFMEPAFYIRGQNGPIPYSVNPTSRVCSACLELFNIIGARFREKLVVPCPGAVLFARMKRDRYYRVLSPEAGR